MSTIPASEVVNIIPGVLPAGGSALNLNGLFLTLSSRPPIGAVPSFPSAAAVEDYFGAGTLEATLAAKYFAGFDNSTKKPGAILFAQYPLAAVGAFLRGGDISSMTVAQLAALNGPLSVTVNGVLKTGTVNLAGSTSFTQAGVKIADALDIEGALASSFTGVIAGTVLTASAVTGAIPLAVGQFIRGAGVSADTYITSLGTGTGGAGTYNINNSQTVSSEAMTSNVPAVTFDSVSGAFVVASATTGAASTITFGSGSLAVSLLLTLATGAVTSQGADAAVPAAFMNGVIAGTRNFATFALAFNPDETGNDIRFAFAQWNATQPSRFKFEAWDSDASPTVTVPATASLAKRVTAAGISGTSVTWQPADLADEDVANYVAFACGIAASIDFERQNGRVTYKFRRQSGLEAAVTDQTVFDNLKANGYNAYGAYGTANADFIWYADGVVSGPFLWSNSYVNQIWLNNAFQLALVNLLLAINSIPYNAAGRATIEAALSDPIQQGLLFGAFRAGVTLSGTQAAAVNALAGREIASTLSNQGYYLLIGTATPEVRQARGSPSCTFFYMDGEDVQHIDLASIALL